MNKLRLLTLLIATLFLTTLASCSKDEDAEPSKRQLLTAHEWTGSEVYNDGFKLPDEASPLDIKSVKLKFKDDRTFTATYRDNGNPQSLEGLWDLKDDGTKMDFPFLNLPGEDSDIKRLTENNFDVSTTTEINGTVTAIELRFVR